MDNYPNLTDHEKSADARELRRALELSRIKEDQWRKTAQRWRKDAQYVAGQRDALRAAVEAVEWLFGSEGKYYCPWCGRVYYPDPKKRPREHAADCQRQRALGLGE